MKKYLLAVYGTLKRGFGNHYLLEEKNNKFLGKFVTKPEFTMYSLGGYPTITREGKTSLHVEVYEIDEQTLRNVYRLEGYSGERNARGNWYDTLDLETPYGKAEMFYFNQTVNKPVIKDGNWKRQF